MIIIDGKEGGGQILRTALGLSAITGKECTIENIRIGRPNPGLQEQHLQGVFAMQKLSNAELKGAEKGSTKIIFSPNKLKKGDIEVKISTAGSVGLILQVLLIPALHTKIDLSIKGGATYGKFAPPIHHFENVLFPLFKKMNYIVDMNIIRQGFFPKGGAELEVFSQKTTLKPLYIQEKGKIVSIKVVSIASKDLEKAEVAERQIKTAKHMLFKKFPDIPIHIQTEYVDTLNTGSGLQITIETEHSFFGGDALGEKGKTAEKVAEEAVESLLDSYENGTVDIHTADMLLPYIALAGGSYKAPKITNHIKTNIQVIEQFLDIKFKVKENVITKI
ncbi:MAG: RNA 3'-terminal phosphate cyclase [bacterium]|nr:RNA 3'-terminal phosphate cyclase [bacterium]